MQATTQTNMQGKSADEIRETMRKYWEMYSVNSSVEEMMLDDSAAEIDKEERPEILSLLPNVESSDILELGAGIGRFSAPLASLAKSVIAVDFMQTNCDANVRLNGSLKNLEVVCEDVTKLELDRQVDLVFSNWLMMYLTDEEVMTLAKKMLRWTKPGGYVFFRESCFHQSGNKPRPGGNPSVYRSPQHYQHLFKSKAISDGQFCFKLILSRTVESYVRIKGNRNQICWLWQKVDIADSDENGNASQEFLDNQQYAVAGILKYEKIFGRDFVSTGGKDTTEEFVKMLDLKPGQHVLDVGCGIGGSCFLMAEKYGARALGLDLSTNMIGIALERSLDRKLDVTFEIADATQVDFPEGTFDVVYSRDTILHIQDKLALFQKFFRFLRPGGKLLISDYCRGELDALGEEFKAYVAQREYHLLTVDEYAGLIRTAGFTNVVGEDRTWQFVECLKKELDRVAQPEVRSDFLKDFSEDDLLHLEEGWRAKIVRSGNGEQTWGLFVATKP